MCGACAMLMLLASGSPDSAQTIASDAEYRRQHAQRVFQDHGLEADGPALVDFFRRRTLTPAQLDALASKIQQLGSKSYRERSRAAADLLVAGEAAKPLLLHAIKDRSANLETVRRAQLLLRQLQDGQEATLALAAVCLLAHARPPNAVASLLDYLPFATEASVLEEIREVMPGLALRDGRPEEALVKALRDKSGRKRGLAGAALIRAGALAQVPAARRLLKDPEPEVRLQSAAAMIDAHDKAAVPVLIELIAQLPSQDAWQAEELLAMIAGEDAPHVFVDTGHSAAQVAKSWKGWWQTHEATLDLTRVDASHREHGLTLITQIDPKASGRVYEVRRNRDIVWEINDVRYPVDAQMIGKDRVLIADYLQRRVTERDLKGKILWEKQVSMPIACQRLPNGQTFIATRRQLLIFDRDGNETFTYTRPRSSIAAARRLRDGEFVVVTSVGLVERLDSQGRVVKSFHVGPVYMRGNIDVLPGGRILVPQYRDNKVVEYDDAGHKRWEARVQSPTSAVRLANGNVLVVSMLRQQVIELARDGHEVWSFRTDGRPWRARRR